METFLVLNGFEISAPVDEQERLILNLAAGQVSRAELTTWLRTHITKRGTPDRQGAGEPLQNIVNKQEGY